MASRVVVLLVLLRAVAGCEPEFYPYRGPCADGGACCPQDTHVVKVTDEAEKTTIIICVLDDSSCADAGIGESACEDAGADASGSGNDSSF